MMQSSTAIARTILVCSLLALAPCFAGAEEPDPLINGLQFIDDLENEVWGEDIAGGGEFVNADSQKLFSLRFKVLNSRLRDTETDGWGLKVQAKIRLTRQEFESIDDIDLDPEKFKTIGFLPKFMFSFPLTDTWSFVPTVEAGLTHEIE